MPPNFMATTTFYRNNCWSMLRSVRLGDMTMVHGTSKARTTDRRLPPSHILPFVKAGEQFIPPFILFWLLLNIFVCRETETFATTKCCVTRRTYVTSTSISRRRRRETSVSARFSRSSSLASENKSNVNKSQVSNFCSVKHSGHNGFFCFFSFFSFFFFFKVISSF